MKGKEKTKESKSKLKSGLLISLTCIAICTSTLAIMELTGFSMSKIEKYVKVFAEDEQISESEEDKTKLSDEASLNGIIINGTEYPFTENETKYPINLPYSTNDMLKIEYLKKNENQEIKGENEYIMTEYSKTISFEVLSEDKSNKILYTIDLEKGYNAYLKNIELPGYNLFPEFSSEETNYTISLPKDREVTSVNIFATAWDKASNIKIEGQNSVSVGSKITITVTNDNAPEPMVYTITCVDSDTVHNFDYKGEYQEFIVPYTGSYKFEVWGARGGRSRVNGSLGSLYGKGGYATRRNCTKKR